MRRINTIINHAGDSKCKNPRLSSSRSGKDRQALILGSDCLSLGWREASKGVVLSWHSRLHSSNRSQAIS